MNYSEQLSLDTPLRLFIRKLWYKFCQEGKEGQQKKELVFQNLLSMGCDYYELLNLCSEFPLLESDGKMLADFAPAPAHIYCLLLPAISVWRFPIGHHLNIILPLFWKLSKK